MTLTLEIPLELENRLRENARRHGLELGDYILEVALEAARTEETRAARLHTLQELADSSQELDLDRRPRQ